MRGRNRSFHVSAGTRTLSTIFFQFSQGIIIVIQQQKLTISTNTENIMKCSSSLIIVLKFTAKCYLMQQIYQNYISKSKVHGMIVQLQTAYLMD